MHPKPQQRTDGIGGRRKMDKWLKSPWFIRITSLLLAILLYTSVNLDENTSKSDVSLIPDGTNQTKTIQNVPLKVLIDQDKYMVSGVPQTVTVTLAGPNSILTPTVKQKNFTIFIDLKGLTSGQHQVNIEHQGISNRLSVNIEPKTVNINLEEKAVKNFPVDVDFIHKDSIDENYQINVEKIIPNEVTVTGSKGEVNNVALVKAIVDLKGANGTIQKQAPVKVYDDQGNELNVFVDPSNVKVNLQIGNPKKEVPFEVNTKGTLPDGLVLSSIESSANKVTIYGPEDVLSQIEKINNVNIDLSTITEDVTIDVDVPKPPGIKLVEPKTIQVKVNVEKTTSKVIQNVPIKVENLQADKQITFIDPKDQTVDVTLYGTTTEIAGITADDLTPIIDVNRFYQGEFDVSIDLNVPKNMEYKLSNQKARVRIE